MSYRNSCVIEITDLTQIGLHVSQIFSHSTHSFIHSGYFYSASLSPLLVRGAPNTVRILCRSFTPKRQRQLQVKDLPNGPTWLPERGKNPRPFGRKATNLPMSHHAPNAYYMCYRD